MTSGDEARRQNEGSRVARSEPLLFLLFICHVTMMSVNHQPHDFSSLPLHIDTTSTASKAPKNQFGFIDRVAMRAAEQMNVLGITLPLLIAPILALLRG